MGFSLDYDIFSGLLLFLFGRINRKIYLCNLKGYVYGLWI